jgi:hypothetical protein
VTAQISDAVLYAESEWTLAGVNGAPLFDPAAHGMSVGPASSACWRGFVCRYALSDQGFSLEELDVALLGGGDAPALFGYVPGPSLDFAFTATYRDLRAPIPFTGGLLLARGFISELYVHMGFHPAWKYQHVVEVELEEGRLRRAVDCGEAMAEIRRKLAGRDAPRKQATSGEVQAWLERTFSRRY